MLNEIYSKTENQNKMTLEEVINCVFNRLIGIRRIFQLNDIDFPSPVLLAIVGNLYQMLGKSLINSSHGFSFAYSMSRDQQVASAVTLHMLLLSLGNNQLFVLNSESVQNADVFETPTDEDLTDFIKKLIQIGLIQLNQEFFNLSSLLGMYKNLSRLLFHNSNGQETEVSFRNLWSNMNSQARIAFLWETLLTICSSEEYEATTVIPENYNFLRETFRLNLSPTALELIKNQKLDIYFPDSFPKDEEGNPMLGLLSIEELERIVAANKPTEEWQSKVNDLVALKISEIEEKIASIRDRYASLPTLNTVRFIPVLYGTKGSFDSFPATSIIALSHGLHLNQNTGKIESSFDHYIEWVKSFKDDRPPFGSLYPYVYSHQNTDIDAHPFSIYIRFPEKIVDLDRFAEAELVSIAVEEYLHLCLYHWRNYFGWPHAVEEFIVNEILHLNGLIHSGTPSDLNESDKIALKNSVRLLHEQDITFQDFLITVNKIVYPKFKTHEENDEEERSLIPTPREMLERMGIPLEGLNVEKFSEFMIARTTLFINSLAAIYLEIIGKYNKKASARPSLLILTTPYEFIIPKSSFSPHEATSIIRPNGLMAYLMSLHKFILCLGNKNLQKLYMGERLVTEDDIEIAMDSMKIDDFWIEIAETNYPRYLAFHEDYFKLIKSDFPRSEGIELWMYLFQELRASLFISACMLSIDPLKTNKSPQIFPSDYEEMPLEERRLMLNHRSSLLVKKGELDFKLPDGITIDDINNKSPLIKNQLEKRGKTDKKNAEIINRKIIAKMDAIQRRIEQFSNLLPNDFPLTSRTVSIRIAFYGTKASFASPLASLMRGLTFGSEFEKVQNGSLEDILPELIKFFNTSFDEREFFGKVFPFYLETDFLHHHPLSVVIRFPTDINEVDDFLDGEFLALLFEEILHISLYHYSTFYCWPHAIEEFVVYKILNNMNISHSETPINLDESLKLWLDSEIDKHLGGELFFSQLVESITEKIQE